MLIPIRGSMSLFPNDALSSTVYLLTFPLAALLCASLFGVRLASLLPPSPHYKFGALIHLLHLFPPLTNTAAGEIRST
jgi:hypothetical protein